MINIPKEQDKFGLAEYLNGYLKNRADAFAFAFAYRDFTHAVDDLVDVSERRNNPEFLVGTFNMMLDLLSSNFYQQNVGRLYGAIKNIQNSYLDSVKWEKADETWKATIGDVLRNCANEMIITVVDIVVTQETGNPQLGYEAGREISWRAKAQSWTDHHHIDTGAPI